jgi:EAL domain-containing protein (putative c-di-GMP-specific phosphodiesterase class I)
MDIGNKVMFWWTEKYMMLQFKSVLRTNNCSGIKVNMQEMQIDLHTGFLDQAVQNNLCIAGEIGVSLAIDNFGTGFSCLAAESVETKQQMEALRALCVDGIQGYYYAKPMDVEELSSWLKDRGHYEQ